MESLKTIPERLRALRERAGLGQSEVARLLGVKNNGYQYYEAKFKRNFLPFDVAEKIATVFSGRGISRDEVMELAGIEAKSAKPGSGNLVNVHDVQRNDDHRAIAEYEPIAESMGFSSGYLGRITKASPRDLMLVSVTGDSMLPTLADEDLVMIDRSKVSLNYDGVFVFRYKDALHIKRVTRSKAGNILAISDNRALYDPVEYHPDEIAVLGRVIWYARKA